MSLTKLVCSTALVLATLGYASEAKAAKKNLLRPATHPVEFAFGLGPAIRMGIRHNIPPAALKLSQSMMFHFSGTAKGPALGFIVQQAFGNNGVFGLIIGPKFEWDIQISRRHSFYVAPGGSIGYNLHRGAGYGHAINLQAGVTGKLILNNRWLLWFRPTNIDIIIAGREDWGARYELMFGGGVVF